ncbi:50S ribosomal protein L9 [Candidatus Hydrogenedentota bacterium]
MILAEDVKKLGSSGDVVTVADGYARNYLIPKKLAVDVASGKAKQIEHHRKQIEGKKAKMRRTIEGVAKKLESSSCTITMQAGEDEKLFGSVTNVMIAEKMVEQGIEIDRHDIELEEPIKALGIYAVPVKLGEGLKPKIKVWVVKE